MNRPFPGTILLFGGSSGTGKSVLARALSQHWQIPALEVDDFRLVMQRALDQFVSSSSGDPAGDKLPDLKALNQIRQVYTKPEASPEDMALALQAVAETMSSLLEIVIAHHIATRKPVILEGDGLLPSLVTLQPVANLYPEPGQLQAVFLIEEEEGELLASFQRRDLQFAVMPILEQKRIVHASWLYGQWIKAQATKVSIPVVDSRPLDTLTERVIELFSQ